MKLVKHQRYETQRSKPWHIIDESRNRTFCGALMYHGKSYINLEYDIIIDELPQGQIFCSVCEKLHLKKPLTLLE